MVPVCVNPSPGSTPNMISKKQIIHKKHGLKINDKIVFHIGSASPWHDLNTLVKSTLYIKSKIILIIAGGGQDLQYHFQNTPKGKVKIIFTGKLQPKELDKYLSAADICVAPYSLHGDSGFFPANVVRYMLAGKAVVATDLPEIREMFKGVQAGILVKQGDAKALAEAIEYLAENDNERFKMGKMGKEIAENNYLTRHHTDQLVRIFKEIL